MGAFFDGGILFTETYSKRVEEVDGFYGRPGRLGRFSLWPEVVADDAVV